MKHKILVIGESCKDIFNYGRCDRLCPDAPVPVFNPLRTIESPGMAMHVLNNVKSLGVNADIITNVNWEDVKKTRFIDEKTNQMLLRIDENEDIVHPIDMSEIDKEKLAQYDAIIVSDYCKGFLDEEKIEKISHMHDNVFLDTKRLLGAWAENIKYIKINYYEHARTKRLISSAMYEKLIITLGSEGCMHRNVKYSVPPVEIKDSSGAGDTFIAALTVEFIRACNIEDAISFANDCATVVVQKRGVSVA